MKMKTLWRFLPLILITIYSCSPKKEKGELVYFSGRIANAQTDSIYLLLNNREKAFALDFDGNFSLLDKDIHSLVQMRILFKDISAIL